MVRRDDLCWLKFKKQLLEISRNTCRMDSRNNDGKKRGDDAPVHLPDVSCGSLMSSSCRKNSLFHKTGLVCTLSTTHRQTMLYIFIVAYIVDYTHRQTRTRAFLISTCS